MPDSLRPLHAGPAGDRLPLYPLEAAGARGAARACRHALSPRLVIATYVVALPLWWFLGRPARTRRRSEEHTSELQSLMRISYAVFCLKKTKKTQHTSTQD